MSIQWMWFIQSSDEWRKTSPERQKKDRAEELITFEKALWLDQDAIEETGTQVHIDMYCRDKKWNSLGGRPPGGIKWWHKLSAKLSHRTTPLAIVNELPTISISISQAPPNPDPFVWCETLSEQLKMYEVCL